MADCDPQEPYYNSAAPLIPATSDLAKVADAAKGCTACHLWRCGTQTVFGLGPESAKIMLVGEQPGDKEDLAGKPFVGPAGKLLDAALEEAGITPDDVYMTNAVKHFKWEPKGSRRLHKKPNQREIASCLPWLLAELRIVQPQILVCLGATAAQALLGKDFKVTERRGEVFQDERLGTVLATVHPSSILRAFDSDSRARERANFITDLRVVAAYLEHPARKARLI